MLLYIIVSIVFLCFMLIYLSSNKVKGFPVISMILAFTFFLPVTLIFICIVSYICFKEKKEVKRENKTVRNNQRVWKVDDKVGYQFEE